MKHLLASGVFALVLLMTACSDKPVTAEQLPEPVKALIQKHFPGQAISYAKKDFEITGSRYEVTLADGTQVDFNTDNTLDKVECMMAPVPADLVPSAIATHVQTHFPDIMIVKIDKESYGYEVELANDIELKFDKHGVLMGVDD